MEYQERGFATADDGTRLFYEMSGTGPAIVLNDGIGCDGFAWKYLHPRLARNHTVIHCHYRGHGRSGPPADPARIDIPALARDVATVLDELDQPHAVMMGHSMGTQVSLELYRLSPSRVRAMVLICGTYGKVTEHFRGTDVLKNVLPTIIETMQQNQKVARALWGRVPPGVAFRVARLARDVDHLAIREEDFRWYWEHINLMAPDVFLPMLRLAGEHSAEDLLEHIEVPTLVIAAERDTFTPAILAEHMAETIPGAEYLLIKGGSHAAPIEQPRAMLRRIERFLGARVHPPATE